MTKTCERELNRAVLPRPYDAITLLPLTAQCKAVTGKAKPSQGEERRGAAAVRPKPSPKRVLPVVVRVAYTALPSGLHPIELPPNT